jgi:hypothetical protein
VAARRRRVRRKLLLKKFVHLLPKVLVHLLKDVHTVEIEEVIVGVVARAAAGMAEIEAVVEAEGMETEMIVQAPDLVIEVVLATTRVTLEEEEEEEEEEVTMVHQVEEALPMIASDQEVEAVNVKRLVTHLEEMAVVVTTMIEEEESLGEVIPEEVSPKGGGMREDEDRDHQIEIVGDIKSSG